jgi:anthranilate synthase component II
MKVLIVDNHDSFTYNLAQMIEQAGDCDLDIIKNSSNDHDISQYDKFIFSPGPGIPSEEEGLMKMILQIQSANKSILGICLGHQAIAEFFGAKVINLNQVYHGIKSEIRINEPSDYLFKDISENIYGGLYHSWCVSENNFPECLKITAMSDEGIIMGIAHKYYDIRGLQFHPESVMTENGKIILKNWIRNPIKT